MGVGTVARAEQVRQARQRSSALARRLRAWWGTREGRNFAVLLGLALLVRLLCAPYRGFFRDVQVFIDWGTLANQHFLTFYSAGAQMVNVPDYPPLAVYLVAALLRVYMLLGALTGAASPYSAHEPLLAALMKAPALAADLGALILIYALARRRHSSRFALIAAASFAFSPAVLLDGALWGQLDGLFALALVLALLCAGQGWGLRAGVLLAAAVLLKPQPILFAPLLLLYLFRSSGWRAAARCLSGFLGTCLVICLPYLLPPHPQMLVFLHNVTNWLGETPKTTISAFNLWWLLGIINQPASAPFVGPVSTGDIGWALFAVVLGIALLGVWRDASPGHLFLGAGLLWLAFFDVTTLQHERYLYPVILVLLVATIFDARRWPFYAVTSATAFLNMAIIVVLFRAYSDISPRTLPWTLFLARHLELTLLVSIVNVVLLIWLAVLYLRTTPPHPRSGVPAAATSRAATAT